MSEVILPWPVKDLNPNSRLHWSKVAKAKQNYRKVCWALALNAKIKVSKTGDAPIHLRVTFFPPDKRGRDLDNMFAMMKSAFDGIADALKVNDKRFVFTIIVSHETNNAVKIELL